MRTTVRWMLPAAGVTVAILAGASHAWAVNAVTATSTTPAGATTTSTLTWDVSPTTGSVNCQLSWNDGSGTPALVGGAIACPFTNNPADPNQVAYAVPGQHAGKYALVVTTPSSGSATSTYVDVVPVKPALTGPAGPSNNRTPSWTIAGIDPEGAVTCSATAPQLASVSASCTPTPDATGHGTVSLDLASAANDAAITLKVTVAAHGESSSTTTSYALDVTAPTPATLTPGSASGAGRTPTFAISNVEPGAAVACSLTDGNATDVSSLLSACDSSHAALNLTGAADGVYTLAVTLTDAAGNSSTNTATYTLLPPAPVVTAPTSPARNDHPGFTVSESDPSVTLTCTLSGVTGATLASSCAPGTVVVDLSGAGDGTVRLTVTATDTTGFTNSGSATYTVDRQVATPSLTLASTSGTTHRIVVNAGDSAADLASLSCAVADGNGNAVVPPAPCGASTAIDLPAGALDGDYTVTATATDAVGNTATATATYTLLQSPPVVDPLPAASTGRTVPFTFAPGADVVAVTCAVAGPGGWSWTDSACASPSGFTIPSTGLDGDYVLTVTVTDHLGAQQTGTGTYTLLQSAPVLDPLPAASTDRTVPFTFAPGADVTSVVCSVAGPGGWSWTDTACASPSSFTIPPTGLDGDYVLTVTVTDHLNHQLSATGTYTLLQSAPVLDPLPAPSTVRAVPFTFDPGPDAASVVCSVAGPNGWSWSDGTCTSPSSFTIPGSGWDGDYILSLTVTDHLGHSLSTTRVYTLLPAAPYAVTGPGVSTSNRKPQWTLGDDVVDLVRYQCTSSVPVLKCGATTQLDLSGLVDGTYSVSVVVVDSAGATSAPLTLSVELIPPAPFATVPASSPTSDRTPQWTVADRVVDLAGYDCVSSVPVLTCGATVQLDLRGMVDGTYSVTVRAVDSLGVLGDPTTFSLTLVAPAPYVVTPPVSPASTLQPSWQIADDVVDFDHFVCTSSVPVLSCASTVQVDLTGLADGSYTVTVRAVDSLGVAGDPVTLSFTLIPPAPYVVTPPVSPASTLRPAWTIADDVVDFDHYTCSSSVPVLSCTSTVKLNLAGLVDGTYSVTVQAVDSLGVAGDPVTLSFTLIPPAPYVVTSPTSPASDRSPQWTFGDDALDAGGYSCSATGPGGIVATALCGVGSPYVSLDLTGLVDGVYSLTVRAIDAQGNAGDPFTVTYRLIPPAPVATASPVSPSSTRTPAWTLTDGAVDLDHYTCASAVRVLLCGPTVQLDLTGLRDGTYSVTVRAVDSLGMLGDPATLFFTMIPPAPYVVTSPTSPASALRPVWTVADDVVDFGHYTCSSAVTVLRCGATVQLDLTGLVDGTYTVTVQAVDSRGAVGDALVVSYTLIPPAPVVVSAPASPSAARQPAWTLTDAAVGPVTYLCSASGPGGINAPVSCAAGATVVLDTTGLPDGTYSVTVRAVDQLGAAGDATTVTYLLVPPPPTATSAPASPLNSRAPQWGLTDDVAGVTYTCSVTGPSAATVSCAGTVATVNLTGAADGVYTISVLAVDALGHSSDPSTPLLLRYQLDTTAPAPPAVGVTPSPSQGRTATFAISGVEPAGTVTCTFSAPAGATVSVPSACGGGATVNLTGQPDGAYVLRVTVTDVAGNTSAATTASYVLDTTAPVAPIATIQTPGNDVTPTPTLVVEPGVTLTCAIQKYFLAVATVPCGTDGTVDLTGLGDGEYEISLWATDAAGNIGPASAPYTYLLDTVAPATPVLTSPASPSPIVDPVWRWTSDPATWGTCSVTNASGVVVAGPIPCSDLFTGDFGALPDGAYTFAVVVADLAGNRSTPATSLFLLDRTAPVPPTVVPPSSPGNTTTPRWLITAPRGSTLTCTLTRGRTVLLGPGACPSGGLVSLLGMPDGSYTMRVTATDPAGNISAASITTYVLDTVAPAAPALTYGSPSAGTSRTPFWGFTLPAGAIGRCELLSGSTVVAVRNDCRGAVSFTITGADGQYAVRIIAVDAAGNASAPLVVGYQLYGHGGGAGAGIGASGSGGARTPRGPKPLPSSTVQRLIDHLGAAAGQAGRSVRKAAGGVASVLPGLPVIHDPLTNHVSHAVQNVINAVSKAGGGTGFPLLLLVLVGFFLMAQSRMDRRDPKLALASVVADDNLQFGPPPSRGDAR